MVPESFTQHPYFTEYYFTESGGVGSLKINYLTGRANFRILSPNSSGRYIRVAICKDGKKLGTIGLHRLVYETFVGEIPDGMEINHVNGNKHDNSISNLECVTPSENVRHAIDTGLLVAKAGTQCGHSKFTEEEIHHIRRKEMKQKEYAALYGVNYTTIQRIQYRKTYKEV